MGPLGGAVLGGAVVGAAVGGGVARPPDAILSGQQVVADDGHDEGRRERGDELDRGRHGGPPLEGPCAALALVGS
jgi:hypothetical protein